MHIETLLLQLSINRVYYLFAAELMCSHLLPTMSAVCTDWNNLQWNRRCSNQNPTVQQWVNGECKGKMKQKKTSWGKCQISVLLSGSVATSSQTRSRKAIQSERKKGLMFHYSAKLMGNKRYKSRRQWANFCFLRLVKDLAQQKKNISHLIKHWARLFSNNKAITNLFK